MPEVITIAISIIKAVIELIGLAMENLPRVEQAFNLAKDALFNSDKVTDEQRADLEKAFVDINQMLQDAYKQRESEAVEMGTIVPPVTTSPPPGSSHNDA